MELLATLRRSGGIDALARQVGVVPATVGSAVEVLLPAVLEGLRAYAQRLGGGDAGIAAVLAMIDGLGDGDLAVAVMGPGPLCEEAGNKILAHALGTDDAKQRLAREVAAVSGQEPALLERLLPPLAMLACGYLSARARADQTESESIAWLRGVLALQGPAAGRPAGSGTNG